MAASLDHLTRTASARTPLEAGCFVLFGLPFPAAGLLVFGLGLRGMSTYVRSASWPASSTKARADEER